MAPGLDKDIAIKRKVNGVLLLNKPAGITSNCALQITKRLFSAAKSGHTGTLDPMATGLLPICFGEATKFSSLLLKADKTYHATIRLGYRSTTGDADGEIFVARRTTATGKLLKRATAGEFNSILQSFVGKIQQLPPMYSAIKFQGKPLYSYARKGIDIKRQPREVTIYDIQVESFVGDELQVTVKCSSGTYIRTLAEDIGQALGYGGAYLSKLCRSAIGRFDLSQAYSLDDLEDKLMAERVSCLYATDYLLRDLPAVELDRRSATSIRHGRVISNNSVAQKMSVGEKVRLYDCNSRFLGLAEISSHGRIIPKRLLAAQTNPG